MNGRDLTLGVVAGLAVAGVLSARRGSASVVAVLPQPSPPAPGTKPSWASSWTKGKAWAREQLEKYPLTHDSGSALDAMDAADRRVVEDNALNTSSLEQLSRRLRLSLAFRVQPKVLSEAQRLGTVASRKLAYRIPTHEEAFWTGVNAYLAQVADAASDEAGADRAEAFMDDVEAELVKMWLRRKREGSRATSRPPTSFTDLDAWTTWAKTQGVTLRLTKTPAFTVEVTDLFADTTGTGAGTKVMQALVAVADRKSMPITLHPSSPRNVDFYQRFGFKLYGSYGMMRRDPMASSRGSRSMKLDFDFFDDVPEPQPSPQMLARRAFEAASGTPPTLIDASVLFRAWPEGIDRYVGYVPKNTRGKVPGWFVYAPGVTTEAEAHRLGKRVLKALIAPRSVPYDQPKLHDIPLTVGWPGGTVMVGSER